MFAILTTLASVVLGIHFCRRDVSSPSVFVATGVLAAVIGGSVNGLGASDLRADDAPAAVAVDTLAVEAVEAAESTESIEDARLPDASSVEIPDAREMGDISAVLNVTDVSYPDRNAESPRWLTEDEFESEDGKDDWIVIHAHVERKKFEAKRSLEAEIVQAANDYVDATAASKFVARRVNYSIDEIRERGIVEAEIIEAVIITNGQRFHQGHALLKFDEALLADAAVKQREAGAMQRLIQTGAAAGLGFLLLGALFGYYRLDTATRGYYTRRLQFATAGTILAIVAAGFLAKLYMPWM